MTTNLANIFVRKTPGSPARTIADYTPEEVARFRASYKPLVAEYRRHQRIAVFAVAAFLLCSLAGLLSPKPVKLFVFIGILALFLPVGTLYLLFCFSKLREPRCPACGNPPGFPFGAFCPECGSRTLEPSPSKWSGGAASCRSCGRKLSIGDGGRSYKIRACSHCGLLLDEQGL